MIQGLLVAALAATASSGPDAGLRAAHPDVLTAATRSVAVGQAFLVELASHGGGGYRWQLGSYDKGLLKLTGQDRGKLPARRLVGPMPSERFHFRAKAPGVTVLEFRDVRPWEGPRPANRIERYPIVVVAQERR